MRSKNTTNNKGKRISRHVCVVENTLQSVLAKIDVSKPIFVNQCYVYIDTVTRTEIEKKQWFDMSSFFQLSYLELKFKIY